MELPTAHEVSELVRAAMTTLDVREDLQEGRASFVVEVLRQVERSGFDRQAVVAATKRLRSMPGRSHA